MGKISKKKTLHYRKVIKEFFENKKDKDGNTLSFKFIDSNDDLWKDPNAYNNGWYINGLRGECGWDNSHGSFYYDFSLFCIADNKEIFLSSKTFFETFECKEELHYYRIGGYPLEKFSEDLKELRRTGVVSKYHPHGFGQGWMKFTSAIDVLYIIRYSLKTKTAIALSLEELEEIKFNSPPKRS